MTNEEIQKHIDKLEDVLNEAAEIARLLHKAKIKTSWYFLDGENKKCVMPMNKLTSHFVRAMPDAPQALVSKSRRGSDSK